MTLDRTALDRALPHAVFFVHADRLTARTDERVWGLPVKLLRDDPATGLACEVSIAPNSSVDRPYAYTQPIEIYVLTGALHIGDITLTEGDLLTLPGYVAVPSLSSETGARFLLFCDDAHMTRSDVATHDLPNLAPYHVKGDASPWVPGTVMAEAGRDDIPLRIRHLKQDADTGARTYLVSVASNIPIPWEVHDIAEEAYVVDGDYTLAECLPTGPKVFEYKQSGYFYRPAGIAHNGPQSGSQKGVVMLIRTPGPLTVTLLNDCPFG